MLRPRAGPGGGGALPRRAGGLVEELAPALLAEVPAAEYDALAHRYDALAHRYGLTIENDWIEDLERTYGVKL